MSRPLVAQAYLESLLRSERSAADDLAEYQARLLRLLVTHALQETSYYAGRGVPPGDLTPASPYWLGQPFVTRNDLAQHFDAFRPRNTPKLHGESLSLSTGGSTGPAVRRDMFSLESAARQLISYRMFHNWDFDQSRPFFALRRTNRSPEEQVDKWGFVWTDAKERGTRTWIDIAAPVHEQLRAMKGYGSIYVNSLPSNILRLSVEALRTGTLLDIPYIVSVGEYLAPEVRTAAREAFGSTIIDAFSSAEGGVIAIQCREAGLYHIQSEQVLAEIISADGQLCGTGETGEVAVTPLYGYATPLLRYRSGDFVESGPTCACGRSLPTISRILGRREHMFDFEDGSRLPEIDRVLITQALGHDRWVLVQSAPSAAVFRHAADLSPAARRTVGENLEAALEGAFTISFEEVRDLPLTSGGKRHFTRNELSSRGS